MGMVGCFAAIDAQMQRKLRDDPSRIEGFLCPDEDDVDVAYSVDVDKAWHAIHFMLTGQAEGGEEPLALAVLGGEEIGEEIGYGPARFLTPQQVQAVAAALEQLTLEEFEKNFQPAAMSAADIYPTVMWERNSQDAFNDVLDNFQQMVTFYRDTAARGDGAVLWLT